MTPEISIANAVVVAGKIGSGKSSLGKKISETFGLEFVSFGDLVRAKVLELGLESTRENLQDTGQKMVNELGPHGILQKALFHSNIKSGQSIVFDGVRNRAVLAEIKKISRTTVVLFLKLDDRVRYHRNILKNPAGHSISFRDFLATSNHPIEEKIEQLADLSDLSIDSAASVEDVWNQVSEALAFLCGISPRAIEHRNR